MLGSVSSNSGVALSPIQEDEVYSSNGALENRFKESFRSPNFPKRPAHLPPDEQSARTGNGRVVCRIETRFRADSSRSEHDYSSSNPSFSQHLPVVAPKEHLPESWRSLSPECVVRRLGEKGENLQHIAMTTNNDGDITDNWGHPVSDGLVDGVGRYSTKYNTSEAPTVHLFGHFPGQPQVPARSTKPAPERSIVESGGVTNAYQCDEGGQPVSPTARNSIEEFDVGNNRSGSPDILPTASRLHELSEMQKIQHEKSLASVFECYGYSYEDYQWIKFLIEKYNETEKLWMDMTKDGVEKKPKMLISLLKHPVDHGEYKGKLSSINDQNRLNDYCNSIWSELTPSFNVLEACFRMYPGSAMKIFGPFIEKFDPVECTRFQEKLEQDLSQDKAAMLEKERPLICAFEQQGADINEYYSLRDTYRKAVELELKLAVECNDPTIKKPNLVRSFARHPVDHSKYKNEYFNWHAVESTKEQLADCNRKLHEYTQMLEYVKQNHPVEFDFVFRGICE